MRVAIQAVTPATQSVVGHLLQLYEYDSSAVFGADVEHDGLYHVIDPDELWQPPYRIYLIRVDDHWSGFAFVTRHPAYFGTGETWLMNEFFVMRKYRRTGVGTMLARAVFARFPGEWQVRQITANPAATAFWRQAIPVHFVQETLDHGPVQRFTITNR